MQWNRNIIFTIIAFGGISQSHLNAMFSRTAQPIGRGAQRVVTQSFAPASSSSMTPASRSFISFKKSPTTAPSAVPSRFGTRRLFSTLGQQGATQQEKQAGKILPEVLGAGLLAGGGGYMAFKKSEESTREEWLVDEFAQAYEERLIACRPQGWFSSVDTSACEQKNQNLQEIQRRLRRALSRRELEITLWPWYSNRLRSKVENYRNRTGINPLSY